MSRTRSVSEARVLLVNMPWGSWNEPVLGIGILKSVLAARGVETDVFYASLQLLRYMRPEAWKWMEPNWGVNDFLFTAEFDPQVSTEQMAVLRDSCQNTRKCVQAAWRSTRSPEEEIEALLRLRQELIPRYLDTLMEQIELEHYDLVGFTALFDQTFSSLALARRMKRARPELMIAFGGSSLQRPVGPALQRTFSEMDVVAYGDGELVIVPLVEAALGLRELVDVPNISYRGPGGAVLDSARVEQIDLDTSPMPDFDDFYLQRAALEQEHGIEVQPGAVSLESSRGCWWGQKSHCTFCGILEGDLRYRSKSAERVLEQLALADARYGAQYSTKFMRFCDYIMPIEYFKTLLPALAELGAPYELYYETKANLTAAKIMQCADAGIVYMQPGIESFDSGVLKRMDKGVTAMQNVFTLFTMLRYGIVPFYNLIFGFPGDAPEEYRAMIKLLPSLYHIMPPETCIPVFITRYAPLSEDPVRFGAQAPLAAERVYNVLFSPEWRAATGFESIDYAYYYENPYPEQGAELRALFAILQHQHVQWSRRFHRARARLEYEEDDEGLTVRDTRFSDEERVTRFGRVHRAVAHAMLDKRMTLPGILSALAEAGWREEQGRDAMHDLLAARVIVNECSDYVWIAFPAACRMPGSIIAKYPKEEYENTVEGRRESWPWQSINWDHVGEPRLQATDTTRAP